MIRSLGCKRPANQRIVLVDVSDPNRGRFGPARFRRPNPDDKASHPIAAPENVEATRAELDELRRRGLCRHFGEGPKIADGISCAPGTGATRGQQTIPPAHHRSG